jgi:hypothetical protein
MPSPLITARSVDGRVCGQKAGSLDNSKKRCNADGRRNLADSVDRAMAETAIRHARACRAVLWKFRIARKFRMPERQ